MVYQFASGLPSSHRFTKFDSGLSFGRVTNENPSRVNLKQLYGRYKRRCCNLIPAESNSQPHVHAQTTKTYYWQQDSRIKKAQVYTKTKTSYEHVGQDTRSQGDKDDQDKQGKDLEISKQKTNSKDNDKGSRSKITQHEGTSLQRRQRPRPQELNDKSNLIDLMKECLNELISREIVSLKILSRTRKFVHHEY
ncbi:hypothetical protein Tco_1081570 [Tanacetum coccineum]|uniref:Uncharacterized protein n=1 Tax=Tanacetum coccineum TaxID=301880 RepID=A0ABQ5HXZ5_9ASTR